MASTVKRIKYFDLREATLASRRAGVLAVAMAGATQAAALAPVDTSALRTSISAKGLNAFRAVYGTNVTYAIYQEFGTSKMPAQPYLRPSADWLKSRGGKIYASVLRKDLQKRGKYTST